MAANNETGAIQPIVELAKALRHAPRSIIFHCDAVAAAASLDLSDMVAACDLVSLAGHKLGGPASSGVLMVRNGTRLKARVVGGGQELDRRAGTQDVAGAVGMATALRLVGGELRSDLIARMAARRDALEARILAAHPEVVVRSAGTGRLAGHLLMTVPGCVSEELLVLLDQEGICASAGAACSSGAPRASHVLLAMGVDERLARGALRLTLSTSTTDEEVQRAGEVVNVAIARLQGV
jgi:cysteine desulfurase